MSPSSPISPTSLRSIRSVSTLIASPTHCLYSPSFRPATSQNEKALPPSPFSHSRPISLIFSPHGIQYSYLASYATSHLVAEAALPLTALLHCMDSISNPWWLGGNICAGVPYGAEIASKLGARLWISAHDGEKASEVSLRDYSRHVGGGTRRSEVFSKMDLTGLQMFEGGALSAFGISPRVHDRVVVPKYYDSIVAKRSSCLERGGCGAPISRWQYPVQRKSCQGISSSSDDDDDEEPSSRN